MTTNMTSDVDGLQSAERRAFIAISASFVASGASKVDTSYEY